MGPVNYPYNLKQMPDAMARKMETATARGLLPPFPSPAMAKNLALKGYPNWAAMKRFNPLSYAKQIQVPTLIIDAEKETLFDRSQNGLLLHETIKEHLESKYIAYPGGHYEMYKGDNQKASRQEAADWFIKHLKKSK
jgi:dipeptidyl aminopeptidase/acylaminoacyl peptidase